jgi:ribonuclease D
MALTPNSITREEVNALPIRRYEGSVVVVGASDVDAALKDILGESVVGFDTETRPAFRAGEVHLPSLAQVATARAVYLFPLRHRELAAAVADIVGREHTIKAGVALRDDLAALRKIIQFSEKSVVDVGALAKRQGASQTGVRNLAAIYLGYRIPKGAKTTNWARATLTRQQIVYAATDAWVCRELYLKLTSGTEPLKENSGSVPNPFDH